MSAQYSLEDLQAQLAVIQDALGVPYKPEVYRDIWADDVRLFVGGRDVTYFRDQITQTSGYQLIEPHAYGPANFQFPQIDELELKKFGLPGELQWLYEGAPAELVEVVDGAYGQRIWAGFVASIRTNSESGAYIACGGDFAGRLSLRDNPALLFVKRLDRGRLIYNAVNGAGLKLEPRLGPETGYLGDNAIGGNTILDYVNNHLAKCIKVGGRQWTIARTADSRGYEMRLKNLTTVHATVFAGTEGILIDVGGDITEKPTDIYGLAVDPNQRRILNAVAPNLVRGAAPRYPFDDGRVFGEGTTNEDTDTGVGIRVLESRLVAIGLLTRPETGTGEYDSETTRAVKALQKRVNLTRTGNVNQNTWDKLFDVTESGRSYFNAEILPFAQLEATRKWDRTGAGARSKINPLWDESRMIVDQTFDHGTNVPRSEIEEWSEAYLERAHDGENLVGTIEFDGADLFEGDVDRNTPAGSLVVLPRMRLREGWNIKVVWDGIGDDPSDYSLFHVAGVDVSGDTNVRGAIDTKARDLPLIGEILARRRETRRRPGREWIADYRRGNPAHEQVVFSEICGLLDQDVELKGGEWNRLEVPVGQFGQVARLRTRLRSGAGFKFGDNPDVGDEGPEYVLGVSEIGMSPGKMADIAGSNPLVKASKWHKPKTQRRLKKDYLFYYTAGQWKQPLGHHPDSKIDDEGKDTGHSPNGNWDDDDGFEFHTSGRDCLLYVYIFPDRDCFIRAGRLMWPAAEQT